MLKVIVHTDGACSGNPGKGGYGLIMQFGKHKKEENQGFKLTTNNRMELLAVIIGLESLKTKKENVTVYSDSKYVVDAVNKKWVFGWEKKNFNKKKREISNENTKKKTVHYLLHSLNSTKMPFFLTKMKTNAKMLKTFLTE